MSHSKRISRLIAASTLLALPLMTGAEGNGCGDVIVGEESCWSTANPESICMPDCVPEGTAVLAICNLSPEAYCYNNFGVCEPAADGCGWQQSAELLACLANIGNGCQADSDCPESCLACADGSCAEPKCVNGGCQVACNPDPGTCTVDDDCGELPWPAVCQLCADGTCATPGCNNGVCELACDSGPPQCQAASDCFFDTVCQLCPDGSCARGDCIDGTCGRTCAPANQCNVAGDCVAPQVCIACPDGTCAISECNDGTCALACPAENQQCGTVNDCAFPAVCVDCGNGQCAEGACIDGSCTQICAD